MIARHDQGREDPSHREDARRMERRDRNAPTRARWSRTPERRPSPCTAARRRRVTAAWPTGTSSREVADALTIPVFGSGDCVTPEQVVERLQSGVEGVLVGRGVLRNPWILAQAADLWPAVRRVPLPLQDRGRFLLEYIELLQNERVREAEGSDMSHPVPTQRRPWSRQSQTRPMGCEQDSRAWRVLHQGRGEGRGTAAPG